MQSTSPRVFRALSLSLSIVAAAAHGAAQSSIQSPGGKPAAPAPGSNSGAPKANDPQLEGLPTFLLTVPGGNVKFGMTAKELADAACQVALPSRPDQAVKTSAKQIETALRRSASDLGQKSVAVETFLLGKWPVKNSEFEVFVAMSRQPNSGMKPLRAPFGWWRHGRKDDYDEKLKEINQMFPGNPEGPVFYWQQKGHELPYKLADKDGKPIDDMPVSFVSYADANMFAAWIGMRLPTEVEWTRAARGDSQNIWPFGDVFTGPQSLKQLRLYDAKDKAPKPVGTVLEAAGPYGHVDMFGSIWQIVSGLGYYPINGNEVFDSEWKVLQKDKAGSLLATVPSWKDTRIITKGGSYLSGDDPIQLLIDQRAPIQIDDVLEGAGFRLAKSLRPGYDTLFSMLRGVFNKNPFQVDQEIDLTGQVGAERYEIGKNGFPTRYQTISFAPVNWLSKEKNPETGKLLDASQQTPLLLGALCSTEPFADAPDVKGRIFSLLYRDAGMPKELTDAIKVGFKEVQAELKAAKKGGAKAEEEPPPEEEKGKAKGKWQEVLKKYGLEPKDLEPKEAHNLDYVRIDGIKVMTDKPAFLVHGNDGKVVAALPATNHQPAAGKAIPSTLALEDNGKGKAVAKFHFTVPMSALKLDRVVEFQLQIQLDTPAPTADKPWRDGK